MTTENVISMDGRDERGRFAPGKTFGRPKGSKNKSSFKTLETLRTYGPKALEKLWQKLDEGDWRAIEFTLKTLLPSNRLIELYGMDADDIRTGIQDGDISPNEGKQLTETLVKLAEISDIAEMKAKIEELSRLINEKG